MLSKNYLIAGGLGFIGSNLVNKIVDVLPDSHIVVLDRISESSNLTRISKEARDSPNFRLVIGDVCNEELVSKIFQEDQIDNVIYLATNDDLSTKEWDPISVLRNNMIGLAHFLEVARQHKIQLFIYISSEEVYGSASYKVETMVPKPCSPLASSQASSEALLNSYGVSYRIPFMIVRLSEIIYGEFMNSHNLLKQLIEGTDMKNMDKNRKYGLLHVSDAVLGILDCIRRGKTEEIYNIGGDYSLSLEELKCVIEKLAEGEAMPEIKFSPSMDSSKAKTELGYNPSTLPIDGFSKMISHYGNTKNIENLKSPVRFLLYGGKGWIGQQFGKLLLEKNVDFLLSHRRPGDDTDEMIIEEIVEVAPSHIVCLTGRTHGPEKNSIDYLEGGPEKLRENVRDNLYGPWILASLSHRLGIHFTYVGTGCIFNYNLEHACGGKGYKEEDDGNYYGNSYSAVKSFTDRLMKHFPNTLNARIRLPINYELDSRNLVAKVTKFSRILDIPNSVTVLPDCLPILFNLALTRRCGTINLVNPGPVSLTDILELYKRMVDPNLTYEIIKPKEDDPFLKSRAHCCLDTSELQSLYPNLRPAIDGIRDSILEIAQKEGKEVRVGA